MNRLKESNIFSGGVIPLNNRRTLLKSYIWNYVVSNSGKATLENSIKGDIDLELIGGTEQLTTIGKNLANPSEFVFGNLAGNTGNIINLKQYITTGHIPVIPGKRYSTSCGNKFSAHTIIAYDKEKTKINSMINVSSEMPEGAAYIRQAYRKIDMTNVTESDMEELKKVCMVNEGSTVLPYEPYTGGKPSPSPEYPQEILNAGRLNEDTGKYEVDVKVNGKNLFDREKARDTANWIIRDGDDYAKFPIRVGKGNKATFSYTEKLTAGKGFYLGIAKKETGSVISWLYYDTNLSISNSKYTIAAEEDYVYLMCNRSAIQTFLDVIKTLQVEISQTQTEYEPYQEPQTLTLTSDRPITKWDRLVEQGGQYGWLYKHRIVNDLSALVKDSEPIYGKDGEKYFSLSLQGALFNYDYNKIYSVAGLCPKDSKIHYVPKPLMQSVVIYVSDTDTIMTAKEHMHYKVIYETTESQFAPLSESEQTQLRNLHSYNGTTHITVDSGEVPCGIKVAYKQKK